MVLPKYFPSPIVAFVFLVATTIADYQKRVERVASPYIKGRGQEFLVVAKKLLVLGKGKQYFGIGDAYEWSVGDAFSPSP